MTNVLESVGLVSPPRPALPGPHAWAGTQTLGKVRFRSGLSAAPPAFLAWQEETCPLLLLVNLPLRGVKRGLGVVFVAEDT